MNETSDKGLDWLLESLIERAVGAQHAVVLSEDGLLMGKSSALTQDNADQLAAVACAFQSLARGTGRQFDGGDVRQTIVEMAHRFLFVTAAGHGACLAVLAAENADLTARLIEKVNANAQLRSNIAELLPHAEAHRKTLAQREAALAKAAETNRARHAAKTNGTRPAHITAPKKATRKSALAG